MWWTDYRPGYLKASVEFKGLMASSATRQRLRRYVRDNRGKILPLAWPEDESLELCEATDIPQWEDVIPSEWMRSDNGPHDPLVLGLCGRRDECPWRRLAVALYPGPRGGVFAYDAHEKTIVRLAQSLGTFCRIGLTRFNDDREGDVGSAKRRSLSSCVAAENKTVLGGEKEYDKREESLSVLRYRAGRVIGRCCRRFGTDSAKINSLSGKAERRLTLYRHLIIEGECRLRAYRMAYDLMSESRQ